MVHPCLYSLICADGVMLRCYGRSKYPRITRVALHRGGPKIAVYDEQSGFLLPYYWSLFRL